MIISRVVSIFLRFGEFVCAAVVLGLMAYFLDKYDDFHIGPHAREIYTIVIASISVLLSLVWLIPTTGSMLHYPFDLLASAAWFAAFGVLVDYVQDAGCGAIFHWGNVNFRNPWCGKWKAAEAFSFISACFWFVNFLLVMFSILLGWKYAVLTASKGVWVYHKVSRDPVATDGSQRRRWYRSRV